MVLKDESELREIAEGFLLGEVRAEASAIDSDPAALRRAFDGLCERGLMSLKRPMAYGGPAVKESAFRWFQETVARASGSLAFLQTQHQSAVGLLAKSENEPLKQEWLPYMHGGSKTCGIGFSQLRRGGPPLLTAAPASGGYEINGTVPWITGVRFFSHFLVGAALDDGSALFGVMPLENVSGKIELGPVMRLAAMESAQTVEAKVAHWILEDRDVLFIKPAGWIHEFDQINIALQGFFALGCAQAGLDIVEMNYQKKGDEFMKEASSRLGAQLDSCRQRMYTLLDQSEDVGAKAKLDLRAQAIELAVKCAHAAIASSGGSANAIGHPAQRVYREALVYTVSAQTKPIMEATLKRIASG